jgi:hypothetical protein
MVSIKAFFLGVLTLFVGMGSALPTNAGVTPAPVTSTCIQTLLSTKSLND